MKLVRKILNICRQRAIAYRAVRNYQAENVANRLYDRFNKLALCSDASLNAELVKSEDSWRTIVPPADSRYANLRADMLRMIDYAKSQQPTEVHA
jgi:hypothetical protein